MVNKNGSCFLHIKLLHNPVCWAVDLRCFHIFQVTENASYWESKNSFFFRISLSLKCEPTPNISRQRQARKLARRKKTNQMLISVSLVFFLSWAPLNLLNLFLEIHGPFEVHLYVSLKNINVQNCKRIHLCKPNIIMNINVIIMT
jgi:hypothetical protein